MTYEIALEKIHSLLTFGSRPGLDRMRELLRRLGNPQDKLRYIHVAGTNGKGSVCAVLSSVLVAAGYKTGLFISPYITDFRERIQINNRMIDKETLARAVAATFPVLEQLREEGTVITEFEYVNALQFYIHAQARCDIVVLETGMGGLLDCTNVIKPPLGAVITAIGRDHTAVLGDTLEAIAEQKCGIIKNGSAAFTSRQCREAMAVIEKTAARMNVPLTKSEDIEAHIEEMTLEGSRFTIGDMEYHIRLARRGAQSQRRRGAPRGGQGISARHAYHLRDGNARRQGRKQRRVAAQGTVPPRIHRTGRQSAHACRAVAGGDIRRAGRRRRRLFLTAGGN